MASLSYSNDGANLGYRMDSTERRDTMVQPLAASRKKIVT